MVTPLARLQQQRLHCTGTYTCRGAEVLTVGLQTPARLAGFDSRPLAPGCTASEEPRGSGPHASGRACHVGTGPSVCALPFYTFVDRSTHSVVLALSLHVGPVFAEWRGAELHHGGGDAAGDAGAVADGGPYVGLMTVGPTLA
jgi:hypothetical protein